MVSRTGGANNLVYEMVDNSVDEANTVEVVMTILHTGGKFSRWLRGALGVSMPRIVLSWLLSKS